MPKTKQVTQKLLINWNLVSGINDRQGISLHSQSCRLVWFHNSEKPKQLQIRASAIFTCPSTMYDRESQNMPQKAESFGLIFFGAYEASPVVVSGLNMQNLTVYHN